MSCEFLHSFGHYRQGGSRLHNRLLNCFSHNSFRCFRCCSNYGLSWSFCCFRCYNHGCCNRFRCKNWRRYSCSDDLRHRLTHRCDYSRSYSWSDYSRCYGWSGDLRYWLDHRCDYSRLRSRSRFVMLLVFFLFFLSNNSTNRNDWFFGGCFWRLSRFNWGFLLNL